MVNISVPVSEAEVSTTQTCSLFVRDIECGSYEADGQTYLVCDDCYPEFAEGFDL